MVEGLRKFKTQSKGATDSVIAMLARVCELMEDQSHSFLLKIKGTLTPTKFN